MEVGKWDQRGEEAQQVPYQTSHSVITLAQPTSELQGKLHPRVVLDRGEGAGALIPLYPSVTEKQDVVSNPPGASSSSALRGTGKADSSSQRN